MPSATARLLEAVTRVAAAHDLPTDDVLVVRDRTNVLVHLRPAPVVARISLTFARLRPPAWFARELEVASFLARAGAPVAPPADAVDPGPHEQGGIVITFWRHVDHDPARFDATAAGRSLRDLHVALERYESPLPAFDRLDEVGEVLARLEPSPAVSAEDLDALRRRRRQLRRPPGLAARPLHGDAHLGNVLWSPDGPLWSDLENVCTGPVEYDLAALTWRDDPATPDVLAAYGRFAADVVEQVTPLLALFLAAWTLVVVERDPRDSMILEARRRVARALADG